MTRNVVPLFVLAALVVASPALFSCSSEKQETQQTEPVVWDDRQLELLTILGDVRDVTDDMPGRWREARMQDPGSMSEEEKRKISELVALPYLQGYKEAPDILNVTQFDPDHAYGGLNLYTSGHAPAAYATDMFGNALHEWTYQAKDAFPDAPHTIHSTFWRRVYWYPNGDILAIFEGIGMVKLDKDSNLLWAYRGGCHHEAFVEEDGTIYVLTRRAQKIPRINAERPVLPDAIAILTPQGQLIEEYPLLECFENSDYKHLLSTIRKRGDIFHTNSVQVFDGSLEHKSAHYKKGNVLISLRKLDTVAIVNLEEQRTVWAASGSDMKIWKWQHDPRVLENGNILIFDNMGWKGKTQIIEFDMKRNRVVWQYAGSEDNPLFSKTCGTNQPLPNGNILITESDNGRALEVTRDKQVVWEFYNPHRAGEEGNLIATLFELARVDEGYFPWMKASE
jgi:hypothetical protein